MKNRLLCITTGFKRSGAPIALYNLLKVLSQEDRYDISIMAYEEGPLRPAYLALESVTDIELLDGLPCTDVFRKRLLTDFDLVFLNTVAVYPFLFIYQNTTVPVYWWIHETPWMIKDSFQGFPNPHLLSSNFHLFTPSLGTQHEFDTNYTYHTSVLSMPVFMPDNIKNDLPVIIPQNRVVFLIPAAYTHIKGQHVLLSAIASLPGNFRDRSYFFCGYSLDTQAEYKKNIKIMAEKLDNVILLDEIPQEDVYALMNRCDCVIAPSIVDVLPLTIVECLMFKKLALVSSKTGISHYIQDCRNGFVFSNDDELFKGLLLIIEESDSLRSVADNGYQIYTTHFSPEEILKKCTEYQI